MHPSANATGFGADLAGAFAAARRTASNALDLVALEARRAGLSLLLMLACGVLGALLAAAAWIGLMAALAVWAVASGVDWQLALAVVALGNLGAAAALFWLCVILSRNLMMPATRRQLRSAALEADPQ